MSLLENALESSGNPELLRKYRDNDVSVIEEFIKQGVLYPEEVKKSLKVAMLERFQQDMEMLARYDKTVLSLSDKMIKSIREEKYDVTLILRLMKYGLDIKNSEKVIDAADRCMNFYESHFFDC